MEYIKTKSLRLRQLNNKNIFVITVLVVIAALLPLGTEYIFKDAHREYLPMSEALNKESALIWLHFVMDMLIGLSYLAISSTLAFLAYKARKDIPFLWMFVAFGAFIVTCGFTHFAATWTLWQPAYYMSGGIKIVTAVASIATAVALPSLVPKTINLIDVAKVSAKRKEALERLTVTLKKQKQELLALNNAKNEFISIASHQLRTPATGVKQYIGILSDGYAGDLTDVQRKYLQTAHESNERQLAIIDDMLNVAHLDQGNVRLNLQKVNINELVRGAADELTSVFTTREQELRLRVPTKSINLQIDPERMRMVIGNLIENASKYSPSHTSVTLALKATAKNVEISIQDEGIGIAQKDLKKLFKKFSRVYNKESKDISGTGLGLYWAQKIVDMHGGAISVESTLGKGTTFTIKLPKA